MGIYYISLTISIGLIVFGWVYGWNRQAQDIFRFELFCLRDRLFDLAKKSDLAYDSDVYINLRTRINTMLKNSDTVSLMHVARVAFMHKVIGRPADFPTIDTIEELLGKAERLGYLYNDEVKNELIDIEHSFNFYTTKHLIEKNPLLIILMLPIVARFFIKALYEYKIKDWKSEGKKSDYFNNNGRRIQGVYSISDMKIDAGNKSALAH